MKNEHQKETEFLRRRILYDDSAERHRLEERITRVQRNERSLRRAMWRLAWLTALAVVGLGYGAVFLENFPHNTSQLILTIFCALGLGSVTCLLVFAGLELVYRKELDERREECRQLLTKLMESRLGKPATTPLQDRLENRVGAIDDRTVLVANEVNGSPAKLESPARG